MKSKQIFSILFFTTILFTACEKNPGEGGTSTIRGKIMVREYNKDFSIVRGFYPGMKEDVYIMYGDDYVYGDKFETGDSGQYEFNYLQNGTYTIYAYSEDSTDISDLLSKKIAVKQVVEITGKNQTIEVPDIVILK